MYAVSEIVSRADRLVKKYGTRNPYDIAREVGIELRMCDFHRQRGAYKV